MARYSSFLRCRVTTKNIHIDRYNCFSLFCKHQTRCYFYFSFLFIYGEALSPNPSGTRLWVTSIASQPSSLKTLGERRLGQRQMHNFNPLKLIT
jgi:hypothetical protein